MKKLGLVDHHLNNFHCDAFLKLLNNQLANEGFYIASAYESNPNGVDWCANNNIKKLSSAEEVAEDADYIMVMAPDNLEMHKEFCEKVFPFKKPVFIDKFLAPSFSEAEYIVKLAEKSNVPIMSSSALFYALELEKVISEIKGPVSEVFVRGLSNWKSYGIHTLSMAIRLMGPDFKRVIDIGSGNSRVVSLDYGNGRTATIDVREAENQWESLKWEFGVKVNGNYYCETIKDYDGFYANLLRAVINFFKTGQTVCTTKHALASVFLLEAAMESYKTGSSWITKK